MNYLSKRYWLQSLLTIFLPPKFSLVLLLQDNKKYRKYTEMENTSLLFFSSYSDGVFFKGLYSNFNTTL
jgi:hypothetical protein